MKPSALWNNFKQRMIGNRPDISEQHLAEMKYLWMSGFQQGYRQVLDTSVSVTDPKSFNKSMDDIHSEVVEYFVQFEKDLTAAARARAAAK